MWTIQAAGKTTADFTDGAGKTIAANSEVAAVKVSGTTEKSIFSVNDGTTYVGADLQAYTPTGTVGTGTKVCDVYIATSEDTDLTEGHWYVTDDGAAFFDATVLADTFADITKEAVANEDAIAALGAKYTGSAFVDLNTYEETITGESMKWCLLGPIFDVSDKLTFVLDTMPANPQEDDVVLYLGETTYKYDEIVDPAADANPKALGWYEFVGGAYVLSEDETVDTEKTYFTKDEEFVQGVIYKFDGTEWQPLNSGDTFTPITNSEIDALFV
jgi:hypothetical protein